MPIGICKSNTITFNAETVNGLYTDLQAGKITKDVALLKLQADSFAMQQGVYTVAIELPDGKPLELPEGQKYMRLLNRHVFPCTKSGDPTADGKPIDEWLLECVNQFGSGAMKVKQIQFTHGGDSNGAVWVALGALAAFAGYKLLTRRRKT